MLVILIIIVLQLHGEGRTARSCQPGSMYFMEQHT